jgi:hypothetical protein
MKRFAIGALALALSTVAYRYLSFTDFSNDHFVHLSVAQQITMGDLPVRDFVERGLPLMPLISAAGQALFGEGLRSELWVIATAYGIAAALTYVVALQMSGLGDDCRADGTVAGGCVPRHLQLSEAVGAGARLRSRGLVLREGG